MIIDYLWEKALAMPVPLFKSDENDGRFAIFDEKGFYLSREAKSIYKTINNLPHIYSLRLCSDNEFYFGRSNQKGGRFKRAHAYHLGGLAYELLGTARSDDQRSHRTWLSAWFDISTLARIGNIYSVRMRETVIVSFMKGEAEKLQKYESALIHEALSRGMKVLNKMLG